MFSHDTKLLASAAADSTINMWDMSNRQCVMMVRDHDSGFFFHCFSHDFKFLASTSWNDYIVKLWDVNDGKCLGDLGGHSERVNTIIFSPDSRFLASASRDNVIKIWDLRCGKCAQTLNGNQKLVKAVTFTHDSQLLASGFVDRSIKLWNTNNWKCVQVLTAHTSCVTSIDFSNDSKTLASGSDNHAVKLWDTVSGQCLQIFKDRRLPISSVAFSHDSKLIVSASADDTIRAWDATSRQQTYEFDSHAGGSWLYFSHDSTLLASAADDKPYGIKIWDTRNGRCLRRTSSLHCAILSLMFSYDLKRLASYSGDNTVGVRDVISGQCMQTFTAYHYHEVGEFFEKNPDHRLFEGIVGLSSFRLDGTNWRTHEATSSSQGCGMSQDGRCITWNSEFLLWLPPEYQSSPFSSSVV